jgi:AI-2 transport protein TqsA
MAKTSIDPKTIIESKELTSLSKVLTTAAAFLITIIGLRYIAQDLIAPILLALFFTVLMYPVFMWFRHKGFSSGLSLLLMILTFFVSMFLLTAFFTWSFSLLSESLSAYVDAFKATLTQTAASVDMEATAETVTRQLSPETVSALLSSILSGLSSFVYYFVFIPILSFMILLQIDSLPKSAARNLVKENPGLARFQKFASSIMIYVFGRLKVNLLTGLLFSLALLIIGVDFPFVWGLLTVILSFIPYIGIIIAGIPPVILAFAEGGLRMALLVIGALVIINLLAENILDPYIQGRGNKISTAAVIIALIFWSWLLGFVGAILSTPLTVLLKTILADYPETRFIASLMEGNYQAPEPIPGKPNKLTQTLGRILPHSNKV